MVHDVLQAEKSDSSGQNASYQEPREVESTVGTSGSN